MRKICCCLLLVLINSKLALAENTDSYCSAVASLAEDYVDDRNNGVPYLNVLNEIDMAVVAARVSDAEKVKFRRDMRASAKIAYIDFPQITAEGIRKLALVGCMSD